MYTPTPRSISIKISRQIVGHDSKIQLSPNPTVTSSEQFPLTGLTNDLAVLLRLPVDIVVIAAARLLRHILANLGLDKRPGVELPPADYPVKHREEEDSAQVDDSVVHLMKIKSIQCPGHAC